MSKTPDHHAVATLKEQDMLLQTAELIFELLTDRGAMYLVKWLLAKEFAFYREGFVTLSAFSCGECSGQQASCGGGCRGREAP
jgi:hypothetical protein